MDFAFMNGLYKIWKQYLFLKADNTIFAMFVCVPLPAGDEQAQGNDVHDDPRGAAEGELLC